MWANTTDDDDQHTTLHMLQQAAAAGDAVGGASARGGGGGGVARGSAGALLIVAANETLVTGVGPLGVWPSVGVGVVLLMLIVFCVFGNFLVIMAILLERDLRNRPQYYLIFSLACADMIVGLVVTPLGAWATIHRAWHLGVALCDFWISVDVLVCTASILHLVAIAVDRYKSITDITYTQTRTPRKIFSMLLVVWIVALFISILPIAGWKDAQFVARVREQHVCLISQEISYQIFSTATAFYIPLCAIIIVYWKIMRAAKRRFRRERDRRTLNRNVDKTRGIVSAMPQQDDKPPPCGTKCDSSNTNSDELNEDERTPINKRDGAETPNNETTFTTNGTRSLTDDSGRGLSTVEKVAPAVKRGSAKSSAASVATSAVASIKSRKKRTKENTESRRERRAWRTLAIITVSFVCLWTPFFTVSLYRPLCNCAIPPLVESVTSWLGYANSALNPIIYTVFSSDLRKAYKRIFKRFCIVNDF